MSAGSPGQLSCKIPAWPVSQKRRHQHVRCPSRYGPAILCLSKDSDGESLPVRRMILMRHAESDESKTVRDHQRPITPWGRASARSIGTQLRSIGWLPDLLFCSNALRSLQTIEEMRQALPELEDADAHFLGNLYTISQMDGQTRAYLEEVIVAEASVLHGCILCLGHNKGWEEAASSFVDDSVKLGNCHAALLEGTGGSWEQAFGDEASWRLVDVLTPESPSVQS